MEMSSKSSSYSKQDPTLLLHAFLLPLPIAKQNQQFYTLEEATTYLSHINFV